MLVITIIAVWQLLYNSYKYKNYQTIKAALQPKTITAVAQLLNYHRCFATVGTPA